MESKSLIKLIELLSVQQINTREINDNTEKFITVKETGKKKKNKRNINRITEFHWGELNVTFIWS